MPIASIQWTRWPDSMTRSVPLLNKGWGGIRFRRFLAAAGLFLVFESGSLKRRTIPISIWCLVNMNMMIYHINLAYDTKGRRLGSES